MGIIGATVSYYVLVPKASKLLFELALGTEKLLRRLTGIRDVPIFVKRGGGRLELEAHFQAHDISVTCTFKHKCWILCPALQSPESC